MRNGATGVAPFTPALGAEPTVPFTVLGSWLKETTASDSAPRFLESLASPFWGTGLSKFSAPSGVEGLTKQTRVLMPGAIGGAKSHPSKLSGFDYGGLDHG